MSILVLKRNSTFVQKGIIPANTDILNSPIEYLKGVGPQRAELLKKELNAIGNNFNQVVHKLHTLDHIAEIKAWSILNESSKKNFMKKVDEIKEKMNQIYWQWLQK
jgi:hypothetical protein